MKILFLTNEWGGHPGGLRRYLVQVITALRARGHTCAMAYARRLEEQASHHVAGLTEYQVPGLDEYARGHSTQTLEKLQLALEIESPDLIFFHYIRNARVVRFLAQDYPVLGMMHAYEAICLRDSKRFYFSTKICPHRLGWRCLLYGHFVRTPARGERFPRYISLAKARDFLQTCAEHTHLIVPSQYMQQAFIHNGFPSERIFKLSHFTAIPAMEVEKSYPREKTLLFLGRLTDRYKGIEYLLHALKKTASGVHLKVVGSGSYLARARRVTAQLDLQDRVQFMGWAPPDQVGNFYEKSMALVVPSLWAEPFGLVGIEAMAHGTPVIAFGIGGMTEWIRDGVNGFEIPWLDTDAMARAIDTLAMNPDLVKQYGMVGRKMVEEEFCEELYMERLIEIFHRVMAAGR